MSAERTLRDGSQIVLRPVLPSDKEALEAGFARLSSESRYRRFFAPLQRLSATDLRYLTEVDHHDHEAILGFDLEGRLVGVARYVRVEEPSEAEVAVVVADDWHGRGAATALLEALVERAREEGIERFVALILEENAEAIELFRNLTPGRTDPRRRVPGQLELIIELPAGPVSGTTLGRALRGAASGNVVIQPWRLLKRRLQAGRGPGTDDAAPPTEP